MATRLKALKITKIALVPKGANQEAHVLLYKSALPPEEEDMPPETVLKADHDAVLTQLDAAKTQIATLTEQVKKLTPADPEDLWKGVSPDLRKRFEEQEARAKRAEEAVALEKAAREKVLYIGTAASYKYLPIKADDDWEVFKALATLPQAQQERIEALFKAAEELGRLARVEQSRGRSGEGRIGSPQEQLDTLARENVSKGRAQTFEDGRKLAADEHPDLYQAYGRSVQKGARD